MQRFNRVLWKKAGSRSGKILFEAFVYILLLGLSFVFIYPFLHMLVTSFKSYNDLTDITVKWFPKEPTLTSWKLAFNSLNFNVTFWNSVVESILATLGHVLACSFIAYGFARYRFPLKNVLFFLVILSIVIPIQTLIVPEYILYARYGMIGSYLPLLLPTFFGFGLKGGLFIFLFRQSFIKYPSALEEAAAIDGCNPYRTFFNIVVPASGSIYLVTFVLSMVWHWNDYFEPGLYITKSANYLLPQMLPSLYEMIQEMSQKVGAADLELQRSYNQSVVMAGTAISIIPLLIMFFALRNKFMQGVERTGLAGD